uniref:Sperm microtubule inner protein 10 n=1 Tax=Salvator merianae TaxID=96440 RepID=A0A8D0E1J8_SALMN
WGIKKEKGPQLSKVKRRTVFFSPGSDRRRDNGGRRNYCASCSPTKLTHCHLPRFSYRHGMFPDLYVMPWKQDMKYRTLALKHANLVGIYTGAAEDTLFLDKRERHCHGEDRKFVMKKVPHQMTVVDIPIYSHLSRYHKSMVAYGFRIKL